MERVWLMLEVGPCQHEELAEFAKNCPPLLWLKSDESRGCDVGTRGVYSKPQIQTSERRMRMHNIIQYLKHLGMSLGDVQDVDKYSCKNLMKVTKRPELLPSYSWLGSPNCVMVSAPPRLMYKFKVIQIKIPMRCFLTK